MTDKQYKFILSLVDQYGYKDSPHKEVFLDKLNLDNREWGHASKVIDMLIAWNRQRKFFKEKKVQVDAAATVQDFSQFVFCPASFAIKSSFELESVNEEELPEDAPLSYLLERIEDFALENIPPDWDEAYRHFLFTQWRDFEKFNKMRLIYNGYSDDAEPLFFIANSKLHGRPHLIFQERDGKKVVVVEKLSYSQELPEKLWPSQLMQALAFLYFFESIACDEICVIVWKAKHYGAFRFNRPYRTHWIKKNKEVEKFVRSHYNEFVALRTKKNVPFNAQQISPNKCFKCSCRSLCNHKSGLINDLNWPYTTPEYSKKYPLYYSMADEQELINREVKEILDEAAEIQKELAQIAAALKRKEL